MVKIALHNGKTIGQVIKGVDGTTIKAIGNRIILADSDICAPFFVLPADIKVSPGMSVEDVQQHDITDSLAGGSFYLELLERIQKLEAKKSEDETQ